MTLFERLKSSSKDGAEKISIHMLQSLIIEFRAGALSRAEVVAALNLTVDQEANLVTIYQALVGASNPQAFWQRVFSYLILTENAHRAASGTLDSYLNEVNFWVMIASEGAK